MLYCIVIIGNDLVPQSRSIAPILNLERCGLLYRALHSEVGIALGPGVVEDPAVPLPDTSSFSVVLILELKAHSYYVIVVPIDQPLACRRRCIYVNIALQGWDTRVVIRVPVVEMRVKLEGYCWL